MRFVGLFALVIFQIAAAPACAQSTKPFRSYLTDFESYWTSPIRWDSDDWGAFGLSAAGIVAAYSLDARVRDHFSDANRPAHQGDPHQWRDYAPAAALTLGVFAVGTLEGRPELRHVGADMVEAAVLGGIADAAFKKLSGRLRPNQTEKRTAWREGGSSFPSGHVTTAFAVAQAFVDHNLEHPVASRCLAYGLAVATGFERLKHNAHWLSDVVAGAALGSASGRFVANRVDESEEGLQLSLAPTEHGLMLAYSRAFH